MRRVALGIALLGCAPVGATAPSDRATGLDTATPVRAEPVEPGLLHAAAVREGRIELARVGEGVFALIDGEPIRLRAGQPVVRDPQLAAGLLPDKPSLTSTHELVAFAGTWVVYAEHADGSGSRFFSYAREGDRWRPQGPSDAGVPEDFRIETHYAALVETGGSLLGLRRPVIHSDSWTWGDELDPPTLARLHAIGRELGEAPRGFDRLTGDLRAVPELPAGWDASDAVATPSGRIVALGFRHPRALDEEPGPAQLLDWAPGEVTATITPLPGLVDPSVRELGIWAAGEVVLVGGLREVAGSDDHPWLAMRERDGSFHEITLALPGQVRERIASATVTATGELWIVTGVGNHASPRPCACLWRKPPDQGWQLVELEPITLSQDADARWAHVWSEQRWIEVPAGTVAPRWPAAREVVAADGVIWVTAELGPSYPTADELLAGPRTALFSSVAVAQPSELVATDQLFDERVDRLAAATQPTPGSDACRTFTLVLADQLPGDGAPVPTPLVERLRGLAEIATIEDHAGWASASLVYVGALDGRAQLVAEANAWDPGSAEALADAFARVLGQRPSLDCRPRAMIRPIERLGR